MTNNASAIIPLHETVTKTDEALAMWEDMIGEILPQHRNVLGYWVEKLDLLEISYAITETAMAPRPSLRYCLAIMQRLYREKEESK